MSEQESETESETESVSSQVLVLPGEYEIFGLSRMRLMKMFFEALKRS